MPPTIPSIKEFLRSFDLQALFTQALGWDHLKQSLSVDASGQSITLKALAQKRGMVAFLCDPLANGSVPDHGMRRTIERMVAKSVHEHVIVFVDKERTKQVWQWVRRETGKPLACREHVFHAKQPGDSLAQKLQSIAVSLEEEERLTLVDVTRKAKQGFDLEKVTKRFYDRFKTEHDAFLKFLKGIPDEQMERWYASVMINRLMFIYFIQKKGFLDSNPDYLKSKLTQTKGKDRYYADVLCPLFFEGFAKKESERSAATNKMLGKVPYLNGGLFLRHQIEEAYGKTIRIADAAFERIFEFFEQYHWHLDERPLRGDNEINPDVLGYIFEKYINQKQMGAYYTKEDITEYIGKNTIIPFLLDEAKKKCRVAFEGDSSVWTLLRTDPDRYIYEAIRRGVIDGEGNIIPESVLPAFVQKGMHDPKARMFEKRYNLGEADLRDKAGNKLSLPSETWREYVERRNRCLELRKKLAAGDVHEVNDLITLNLDIRQFAQDVVETSEGPDLLNALWQSVEKVTVLDPTCGSGAFLFAALNILEPLYEACLDRMEIFLDEWGDAGTKSHPNYAKRFSGLLDRIDKHPNRRYFVLKSIVINNLYGVDIMEEATEICKLRLFLKLVAQIENVDQIEPLPDIDFNIRAGNTLVGFATYAEVEKAITSKLDFGAHMQQVQEAIEDLDEQFRLFREQQTVLGGLVELSDKSELLKRLSKLQTELNEHLGADFAVGTKKGPSLSAWIQRYHPFHWFVEFHGIMSSGGFDVLMGNPPYIELKALREYVPRSYLTEDSGNLYALMLEKSFMLRKGAGRSGFIVPVSSISTDRYQSLQKLLRKNVLHYSSYDDRPSRLFEGLEHIRLTIHLIGSDGDSRFSSRYNKWVSDERPTLFQNLVYASADVSLVEGSLPKLASSLEAAIVAKLSTQPFRMVSSYASRKGSSIYYSRKVGYFLQALDFEPKVLDGRGERRPPSEFKELVFESDANASIALACLNSTMFYWFVTVHSDCRHVNKREVDAFPVDLRAVATSGSARSQLANITATLMKELDANSELRKMKFQHDTLTVQCIFPRASKSTIDRIDEILGHHYRFTVEELDFVINYDIKYRMGKDAGEEE